MKDREILQTEGVDINIRPMAPSDIGAVVTLDEQLSGEHQYITYEDLFGDYPSGKLDFSYVAVTGARIIGFIISHPTYLYVPFTMVCLVNSLGVHPDYQRLHIGSMLIQELVNKCRDEDITIMRALVESSDSKLRHFIEQLGFRSSDVVNYDKLI